MGCRVIKTQDPRYPGLAPGTVVCDQNPHDDDLPHTWAMTRDQGWQTSGWMAWSDEVTAGKEYVQEVRTGVVQACDTSNKAEGWFETAYTGASCLVTSGTMAVVEGSMAVAEGVVTTAAGIATGDISVIEVPGAILDGLAEAGGQIQDGLQQITRGRFFEGFNTMVQGGTKIAAFADGGVKVVQGTKVFVRRGRWWSDWRYHRIRVETITVDPPPEPPGFGRSKAVPRIPPPKPGAVAIQVRHPQEYTWRGFDKECWQFGRGGMEMIGTARPEPRKPMRQFTDDAIRRFDPAQVAPPAPIKTAQPSTRTPELPQPTPSTKAVQPPAPVPQPPGPPVPTRPTHQPQSFPSRTAFAHHLAQHADLPVNEVERIVRRRIRMGATRVEITDWHDNTLTIRVDYHQGDDRIVRERWRIQLTPRGASLMTFTELTE